MAKLDRSGVGTTVLGNPNEAALIVAAEKAGLDPAGLDHDYPRTREVPFSSETKRMVTVHTTLDGRTVAYVKGSPVAVLEVSVSVLGADVVAAMSAETRQGAHTTNDGSGARLSCACCCSSPPCTSRSCAMSCALCR
jgi:Ca2+-transporting ATPase